MRVGRTLLQADTHNRRHGTESHIYICSRCRGRSSHEPSEGNGLALHEMAKGKKYVKTGVGTENVILTTTVVMSLQGQLYNLQITSFNGKPINTPFARLQNDSSIGRQKQSRASARHDLGKRRYSFSHR